MIQTIVETRLKFNRLLIDSFWAVLGNFIGKGLSFASGVVVARVLGKESFGEYSAIMATLVSASVFSTFGLGYTSTKYIAEFNKDSEHLICSMIYYSRIITLFTSSILSFLIFLFARVISTQVFGDNDLTVSIRIVSLWVVFNAMTTTQTGILAGYGQFKGMARINTYVGFFTFCLSVIGAYFFKLNGLLFAILSSQCINWVLNSMLLRTVVVSKLNEKKRNRQLLRQIIRFSTPIALQEALYSVTSFVLPSLIIFYSNFSELGVFTASTQISALILFVPGILRNVFLTHFSRTSVNDKTRGDVFKTTLIINLISTIIPVVFVFLFIGNISYIYGTEYNGIENMILISCVTAIIISVNNIYNQILISEGRNWSVFWLRLTRDFVLISSFIFFTTADWPLTTMLLTLILIVNIGYFIGLHLCSTMRYETKFFI